MRPQGSPAELERPRLRAIELLQRAVPVHARADRLGVDRRSARRWKPTHRRHVRAGLRARPASGRPPKLTTAQRRRLARLAIAGPEAAGYRESLWTRRRIVDQCRLPSRSRRWSEQHTAVSCLPGMNSSTKPKPLHG
jgi:transposase